MRAKSKHPFNAPHPIPHLLHGGHVRSSPSFLLDAQASLPLSVSLCPPQLFFRFLPNFFAAAPSFSAFLLITDFFWVGAGTRSACRISRLPEV